MRDSRVTGSGRFADSDLFIMTSLADGPKHGYAMMEDIHRSYGVRLGPGTLYTALSRLEKQALIEPLDSDDRRKPYRLTTSGLTVLRAQLSGLQHLAASGLHRLTQL